MFLSVRSYCHKTVVSRRARSKIFRKEKHSGTHPVYGFRRNIYIHVCVYMCYSSYFLFALLVRASGRFDCHEASWHGNVMTWKCSQITTWLNSHRWITLTRSPFMSSGEFFSGYESGCTCCSTNGRVADDLKCYDAHVTSLWCINICDHLIQLNVDYVGHINIPICQAMRRHNYYGFAELHS